MFRPSKDLQAMIEAARRAGTGLMQHFRAREKLVVELKGPADFVSAADRESEETLRSMLLKRYPRHGFLTEESAPTVGVDAGTRFVVDPLDGTTNFLHGIPHFAVAIGLEHEGRIVAGVVHDPPKNETFVAERGRGAWLGRERLHVTADRDLSRALVATGVPHANSRPRHGRYLAMLAEVMREAAGIRRFAAAALDLSYVAAGRFAVFFELGLSPWDMAAGSLLVEEAGGKVTRPDGGDDFMGSGDVLATNGRLHAPTLAMIRRATRRASSASRRPRTSRRA
jgi:myo-inositol-1(or 4)-monophosphatase